MSTTGKSFVSQVVGAVVSVYVSIGVGIMAAVAVNVTGLGRSLIPGWAWNTCVLLFATGVAVAIRTRDIRGIAIGSFMLLTAMLSLGMGQAIGTDGNSLSRMEQTYKELASLMSVLFPIVGGLVAVGFPLLSPRHVSSGRR